MKRNLILKGGVEEKKIVRKLSKNFFVTFSKASSFKNSDYTFAFLRPDDKYNRMFNLHNEILVLFSAYTEFDTRTFDFVDKLLHEYDNRLDKICILLVSKDKRIQEKIVKLNNDNRESKIVVPFTYEEILSDGFDALKLENKLRRSFYNRDLFALESPLKSENYFFGRASVVQAFYDKYSLGEHSGLFGLRKIGKTSVLYAVERIIREKKGTSIYIDCQNTAVHKCRWYELLFYIIKSIKEKYSIDVETNSKEQYTEKDASEHFEVDLKTLKKCMGDTRVLIIFDEIEHISFKTSSTEQWRNGEDYIYFWQSIRAIYQKNEDLFCFIVAGVNPLCIEQPTVNEYDNPIFSLMKPTYLNLFQVKDVREMITSIGSYMGIKFQEKVFTYLHDDYGGHPFLIRHVCSLINTDIKTERPVEITEFVYKDNKVEYDNKIQNYVQLIIGILQKWYPNEYHLLEILVEKGSKEFKEEIGYDAKTVEHLLGYGILKEEQGVYFITISALEGYIKAGIKSTKRLETKEEKWKDITVKRNQLEEQLRKLILTTLQVSIGKRQVKETVLKAIEERRREGLREKELKEIFTEHLYFLDLKQIVVKNWVTFEKFFIDKTKFQEYMDFVNKYRIDAHCKDISSSDLGILMIAFKWFNECFDDLIF
ncbi:hypothetical protein ABE30_27910 [Bacillus tropicus]|nr:hypothetical protein [Bacillus tropicus]MBG9877502.1 hypothetical protein [Bacillus tropicus]MBG9919014.1 hypothetical protein [Bacillus tropicus]